MSLCSDELLSLLYKLEFVAISLNYSTLIVLLGREFPTHIDFQAT